VTAGARVRAHRHAGHDRPARSHTGFLAYGIPPCTLRTCAPPPRPPGTTEADWQAILAVGDRALFAYRLRKARLDGEEEQGAFIEGSGVSQQTLSEWERGARVHITTAMLHTAAHLLATSAARLL
jgi:hypothetical protein